MRQAAVKANGCGAALHQPSRQTVLLWVPESSPISLTVILSSSSSKGGRVIVFAYMTCCGTASSVAFRIRHSTLFNKQDGGFK
jgi:hypothetical protein